MRPTSVIDEKIIELRASKRKWAPFVLGSVGPSVYGNHNRPIICHASAMLVETFRIKMVDVTKTAKVGRHRYSYLKIERGDFVLQ